MANYLFSIYEANRKEHLIHIIRQIQGPITSIKFNECLKKAIQQNDIEIARLLLEKGADINYYTHCVWDQAPLLAMAAAYGRKEIFSMMMELESSRFENGSLGHALLHAVNKKYEDAVFFVQSLFNKNIPFDPNKEINIYKLNAMDMASPAIEELIRQHGGKKSIITPNHFNPAERGKIILFFLNKKDEDSAKSFLNSSHPIEFSDFRGTTIGNINDITKQKLMSRKGKQILALHFINQAFNKINTQQELLELLTQLKDETSEEVKKFLIYPEKSRIPLFRNSCKLDNEEVDPLWIAITKLAKNRLLEIIGQDRANTDARGFLQKKSGWFKRHTTTSEDLLSISNPQLRANKLQEEKEKTNKTLSEKYGFNTAPAVKVGR